MARGGYREAKPPADVANWLTVQEGAALLDIRPNYFLRLMNKGDVPRYPEGVKHGKCWFWRADVESLWEFRRVQRAWRAKHGRDAGKRWTEKIDPELAARIFLTAHQAAAELGCTIDTLHGMVRSGRLVCYQEKPGHRGSRLWFSPTTIRVLREDAARATHRASHEKAKQTAEARRKAREAEGGGEFRAQSEDTGEEGWLNSAQAAQRLGVSAARVRALHLGGRLRAEKVMLPPWHKRVLRFHAADVENLRNDASYQKQRAKWERANSAEGRAAREAARWALLGEYTRKLNHWDDPNHEFTYKAWPGRIW